MAGHSKWANIRYRKAQQDARKGKRFTQHIREIVVAARTGGSEASTNPRLRTAIDKALSDNMTRETIQRAIQRGAGNDPKDALFPVLYEGYAPGGGGVLIDCLTNNKNRTVGEIRHSLTKCGGNLAQSGSVRFLFEYSGLILLPETLDENTLIDLLSVEGIKDIEPEAESTLLITHPEQLYAVQSQLASEFKLQPKTSELVWLPKVTVALSEAHQEICDGLLEQLEQLDDVQHVYHNWE